MAAVIRELPILRPQFAIGSHVRLRGSHLCGSVRSVLRFPRAIAYGILYCDNAVVPAGWTPTHGTFTEAELEFAIG